MPRSCTQIHRWALWLIVLVCAAWGQGVRASELTIERPAQDLTAHLSYAVGTSADPADMVALYKRGGFSRHPTLSPYSANHAPELWAAIELSADTTRTGRVIFGIPLVSEVDLYLVQDTAREVLLSYSLFRSYDAAQHSGQKLQSLPFQLASGAPVILLAHIKFGPVQTWNMAYETPEITAGRAVQETAASAMFYAFALSSILVFVAMFGALRDWISLLYAIQFCVGLALLAYLDGLLFRFVFPNMPQIQSGVGFFLLYALAGTGLALAAFGFREAGRQPLAKASAALAAACVLAFGGALISPGPYMAAVAYVLLAVMCVAVFVATRSRRHAIDAAERPARILGLLSVVGLLVLLAPLIVPGLPALLDTLTAAKAVFLILILGSLFNVVSRVIGNRQARDRAQVSELEALRREAEVNRALLDAEKNYAKAQQLAQHRSRQLATATHDLRQPLTSLRMSVDALAAEKDPDTQQRLRDAFDYIAELSARYLDDATEPSTSEVPEEDPYSVSLIQDTVLQMFEREAQSKSLRLRMVASRLETTVPPMALMRITSNLVSNAIKYTDAGGVVVGICRKAGQPHLCVVDTGPGLSDDDLLRMKEEGAKGATSDGHGLGLAVCFALAQEHGLTLTTRSVSGQGTGFFLTLR